MDGNVLATWIDAMDNVKSLHRNAQIDTSSYEQLVQYYSAESLPEASRLLGLVGSTGTIVCTIEAASRV